MKTLFLLRHAKSSWKDETLPDFERPLNSRGVRTTKLLSQIFTSDKVKPDLILSSCAVRARETIERVLEFGKVRSELRFDERIYDASIDRLLEVVHQIDKSARSVMIVGHNPGLEELITALTGQSEIMPTGTLAKITFDSSSWSNVGTQLGTIEWLRKPKELEKSKEKDSSQES